MKTSVFWIMSAALFLGYAQSPGIEATLVNSDDEPVSGATVWFYSLDDEAFGKTTESGLKGQFELRGDLPTGMRAYIDKEGFHPVIYAFGDTSKHTIQILDEADAAAQGLVEKHRTATASGIYAVARALFNQEQFEAAADMAQRSLALEELMPTVKLAAFCSYKANDWEATKSYAETYLKNTPDDTSMMSLVKEAEKQLTGMDPVKMYNKAIAAINADDDDTAQGLLLKVIEHDDKFALAYFDLGQINIRAGDFEQGIDYLKTFVKLASKRKHKTEIQDAKDLIAALDE